MAAGTRFIKLDGFSLDLGTRSCMYVLMCMYWTRLVLIRPAAPLKHHPTGRQWYSNLGHYPHFETASRSLTIKQSSRTSNCHVLFVTRPGIEAPTPRMPGKRSTTTLPACGGYTWSNSTLAMDGSAVIRDRLPVHTVLGHHLRVHPVLGLHLAVHPVLGLHLAVHNVLGHHLACTLY